MLILRFYPTHFIFFKKYLFDDGNQLNDREAQVQMMSQRGGGNSALVDDLHAKIRRMEQAQVRLSSL